jgi:hypothetical protein
MRRAEWTGAGGTGEPTRSYWMQLAASLPSREIAGRVVGRANLRSLRTQLLGSGKVCRPGGSGRPVVSILRAVCSVVPSSLISSIGRRGWAPFLASQEAR